MSKFGGITNDQARYLAALQRGAGEQYSGSGMSSLEASEEITRLKELGVKPSHKRQGAAA